MMLTAANVGEDFSEGASKLNVKNGIDDGI